MGLFSRKDDRTTEEKYLDVRGEQIWGKGSKGKKEWDELEVQAAALDKQRKAEQRKGKK
jgi:hypothetical protein